MSCTPIGFLSGAQARFAAHADQTVGNRDGCVAPEEAAAFVDRFHGDGNGIVDAWENEAEAVQQQLEQVLGIPREQHPIRMVPKEPSIAVAGTSGYRVGREWNIPLELMAPILFHEAGHTLNASSHLARQSQGAIRLNEHEADFVEGLGVALTGRSPTLIKQVIDFVEAKVGSDPDHGTAAERQASAELGYRYGQLYLRAAQLDGEFQLLAASYSGTAEMGIRAAIVERIRQLDAEAQPVLAQMELIARDERHLRKGFVDQLNARKYADLQQQMGQWLRTNP